MSLLASFRRCRASLLILGGITSFLCPAFGFEGAINSATLALTERARFEAHVPTTFALTQDQAFSMHSAGHFFTGSAVQAPGTTSLDSQIIPLPAAVIRKFAANGSPAWVRVRQVIILTIESTGVSSAFERHSAEEDPSPISMDEVAADQVTHVLATRDGGVVVAADLYETSVEFYEGHLGTQGRREFPARLGRTLYRKFDAAGNLVWKRMTSTDTSLVQPTNTLELLETPDGSIATLARSTTFSGSSLATRGFNQQTIVRVLNGRTGELAWQKIFGGDSTAGFKDSAPLALKLDAQGRLYVLSWEQPDVFNPAPVLTRNVVRQIEANGSAVAFVESLEQSGARTESWTLLAVDAAGSIHVAGRSHLAGADLSTSNERQVVLKYGPDLQQQWRREAPEPPRRGGDVPAVRPVSLHAADSGVTLVGVTSAVANDGYNDLKRTETMRFSPEGALLWHRYLEAAAGDAFYGAKLEVGFAEVDAEGNVYLAGYQTTGPGSQANLAKYSSTGLLQFVRLLAPGFQHSDFTLTANGRLTTIAALANTGGTSAIFELANPAVQVTPPTLENLTVSLAGPADSGTVTRGFEGDTARMSGTTYTVTAAPKAGFLFTHWSGGLDSSSPSLTFVMTPGLALTAHFAPNSVLGIAGTYTGLGDLTGEDGLPSALFSAKVGTTGVFSARFTLGDLALPLRGQFDLRGNFEGRFTIARKSVAVNLHLDVEGDTQGVAGTITVAGVTYAVGGNRHAFSAQNPAPQAGLYTFILPAPGGSGVPAGDSWFIARINSAGAVRVTGALADRTPIIRGGTLGADGSFALYASLYAARGVLAGSLRFAPVADPSASDVTAIMAWQKPSFDAAPPFDVKGDVIGSLYAKPDPAQTVFGAPGNVRLQFDTTPAIPEVTSSLAANGRGTKPVAGFTLQFANANGTFAGRAPLPLRTATFHGVVLDKQQVARGFVKGGAVGAVSVAPQP